MSVVSATASVPPLAIMPVLEGLCLDYDGRTLFDQAHLSLAQGQWTCLLGRSGAGKSTLLHCAAGVGPAQARFKTMAPPAALMAQRDLLLPWATVLQNVTLGARLRGETADKPKALALLAQLGLDGRAESLPASLSGGERQRVALARTLMEDRALVLMDEPFAALDALTRHELQAVARKALAGRTVLMVTHDPWEALRLADQILVLSGTPGALLPFDHPLPGPAPRDLSDAGVAHLLNPLQAALGAGS